MGNNVLTRRHLLAQVPAAAAAVTLPTASVAAEPSPLRASYHEWIALREAFRNSPYPDDSPEDLALSERITALEDHAARFLPSTVEDFAWKIIFADDNGDLLGGSVWSVSLLGLAYLVVGEPIPAVVLKDTAYFRHTLERVADPRIVVQVDALAQVELSRVNQFP